MQSLLLRLEADVQARKQARPERRIPLRFVVMGGIALFVFAFQLGSRAGEASTDWNGVLAPAPRPAGLALRLDEQQGKLEFQNLQIERLERVHALSSRYGIGADLAAAIQDIALAENVDPRLAFELVRVESGFSRRAVSPVGALGYTQLMPATARLLQPGITREQIFDRDTNLRLGFRFYRSLLNYYKGNERLALLAYNRGPGTVDRLLKQGKDPANGYARMVLGR